MAKKQYFASAPGAYNNAHTNQRARAPKRFNALDPKSCHPFDQDTQQANQSIKTTQQSFESIVVKDSCDVEVTTTNTQAAVNVQIGLQAAIALIISISVADSDRAEEITQDLYEKIKTTQVNHQQTYIENSRGVQVTTTDTDIAVNAQILLQVLLAIVARLNIL
ncbi:spore coat protein [Alkalibacillus haloalkaliphilus]|uniref:spore coat protein n=1 Tax=Alkalibacillus haloalkaliphilus TaxID=94136 RepID=UPI002935427E|nr:spore coat protein [Alkalibacillus haloalkaliphilus]MDV2581382.1 spore coat protein [Alkalibacillus haloalkaliphilus]